MCKGGSIYNIHETDESHFINPGECDWNITVFISFDRHEKSEMWDEKWEDWIKSVFNPSY